MTARKKIVLKLTGELLGSSQNREDTSLLRDIIMQVKQLSARFQISLIAGGGNFFRGAVQAKKLGISTQVSHYGGMLATMINGLIIQDICQQLGLKTALFTAIDAPEIGMTPSPAALAHAQEEADCLIFSGGTGNPYFTTDTAAVLRALQVGADELWKGTKVDGIYTQDPLKNPEAQFLPKISFERAIEQKIEIMDLSAFVLAMQHNLQIRIFNIFLPQALIKAADNTDFGSIITHTDKGIS